MKPTGLLIAVALLAVIGGGIWWSNKKQAATPAKSPTDTSSKLLTIPADQFQEIRIKKLTGETQDLKLLDGKWRIVEPKPLAADQDTVTSMVSSLSALTADKTIEDNATDLKQYGLDDPALDIAITEKDGKTAGVLVGDATPTNSGNYAKLPGSSRVYTIASFVKTGLDKTVNDLRDKRLLTFDPDKITRVELAAKGAPIEFGKNAQNEWEILKPRPLRADGTQVDSLVSKLKDTKMDALISDEDAKKAAAAFASGAKVAVVTVSDSSGDQTLEVRKDKDKNYYAKSSVVEGIYKIPSDTGDALDKGLDDFRNKKLFDFGFSDPTKIELKGATYTKSGDKWMSGAKTMDNASVQSLIDKLRDLTATKFADTGGGDPVFEAAVTSNEGKKVEKVTIRKQGTDYFAQREGEPSIYVLDAKPVEDLQAAAAAIKEAAPEPAKKK
jgi:ribosomal protein L12E/L44/L45/RPP1/RPP2